MTGIHLGGNAVEAEVGYQQTAHHAVNRLGNEHGQSGEGHVGSHLVLGSHAGHVLGETGAEQQLTKGEDENLQEDGHEVGLTDGLDTRDDEVGLRRHSHEQQRACRDAHTRDHELHRGELVQNRDDEDETCDNHEGIQGVHEAQLEVVTNGAQVVLRHHQELQSEHQTHTQREHQEHDELLECTLASHLSDELQRALSRLLRLHDALLRHGEEVFINEAGEHKGDAVAGSTEVNHPQQTVDVTLPGQQRVHNGKTGQQSAHVHEQVVEVETCGTCAQRGEAADRGRDTGAHEGRAE